VFPRVTIDLEDQDFEFEMPDIPLPYYEDGNTATPWQLVSTTKNSAKFQINMDFTNPAPVALLFQNARARIFYDDDVTGEAIEVSAPCQRTLLSHGPESSPAPLVSRRSPPSTSTTTSWR
jgi:hypothetical protein